MDAIQPLAAIVLVVALLSGGLLVLKKRSAAFPGGTAQRHLEVVDRVSLGPHHSLHLVRAGGRLLLVATAPNSCQLLDHAVSGGEEG
jgi:flagellar biogenesis protein FliO